MKSKNIRMEVAAAVLTLALAAGSAAAQAQETAAGAAAAAFESLDAMDRVSISPMSHMDAPPIGEPARYQRNGWSEASRLCERMLSGSAHSCLDTVRQARFFTPEAVDVCAAMSYDADKADCLRAIADHPIAPQEAWECTQNSSNRAKTDCLAYYARLHPSQDGRRQDPWGPRPGYDSRGMEEAAAVCRGLDYDSSKAQCARIIGGARMFSPEAARICGGLDYDSSRNNCLEAIKDRFISPQTASLCAGMDYDSSKIQCLRDASSREPGRWDGPWGPGHGSGGMDEAAGACRKLSYDSNRNECVRVIGSARFFSPEAARVCAGLDYDSSVLSCLKAVKDRDIQPQVARICGEMDYDSQAISCLNDAGAR